RRVLSSSPQLGQTSLRNAHSVAHMEQSSHRLPPPPSPRRTAATGFALQNGQIDGVDSVVTVPLMASDSAKGCNTARAKNRACSDSGAVPVHSERINSV